MRVGIHLLALFLGTNATISLAAEQEHNLTCHPVTISSKKSVELCTPDSYRDELVTYLNLDTLYMLRGEPWVDRVELFTDLTDNKFIISKNRAVLRMNAFLRVRDAKQILDNLKPRITLIRASQEIFEQYKTLQTQESETVLNQIVPLKEFLDAPFMNSSLRKVDAESVMAAQFEECKQEEKTRLEKSKTQTEVQLKNITEAQQILRTTLSLTPEIAPKKGQSLMDMAEDIHSSDCDLCERAVQFCKQNSYALHSNESGGGCKMVIQNRGCFQNLPPELYVAVESCIGTDPKLSLLRLQVREKNLRKTLAEYTSQMHDLKCTKNPSTPL